MDEPVPTPDPTSAVLAEACILRVPSRPEWIAPTVELLRQKARLAGVCHESRAGKLVLVLHEALTNAIIHGNLELSSELKERDDDTYARTLAERAADPAFTGRQVQIDVESDLECCSWTFTDEGPGFDFQRYLEAEPDPETLLMASGRGIMLMRAFVDDIRYDLGGRKLTLTMNRASGAEKRREPRLSLHQRIQVAPIRPDGSVDWQAAYLAVAQNLSAQGIGILQAQLATSERVLVGVEVEGRTIYVPAQVRHCQPVGESVVELGCRFTFDNPPAPAGEGAGVEAIEEILCRRRQQTRPADERRSHTREVYTERIEVLGPEGTTPVVGFARDLSRGGIAFITTAALPLEPRIICLPLGSGGVLRIRALIVRCVGLTPGFYDVGASFLRVEE